MARRRWTKFIREQAGMPGCLYALRGSFVQRLRNEGIRLPVGYIGEDVLLQLLLKTDLDPTRNPDRSRIALCESAAFEFDSMSVMDPRDWRLYWRRRVRNALRKYQHALLTPILRSEGLSSMPRDVETLYARRAGASLPKSLGLERVFERHALQHIARVVKQKENT